MMTCHLQDKNKLLRYHTLCKNILKCGFPTKVIKLTRFILLQVLRVHQLIKHAKFSYSIISVVFCKFSCGTYWNSLNRGTSSNTRKFTKYNSDYGIRKFSVLDKLVRFCICSQHGVFPLSWWYFPLRVEKFREFCTVLRVELKSFNWCSRGLSHIERNLRKWILSTKSSCITR